MPLLLLLLAAYRPERPSSFPRSRLALSLGLAAVTAGWLVMRYRLLPSVGVPTNAIYPSDNPLVLMSLPWRGLNVLRVQGIYLGKMLFPAKLEAVFTDRTMPAVRAELGWDGVCFWPPSPSWRHWQSRDSQEDTPGPWDCASGRPPSWSRQPLAPDHLPGGRAIRLSPSAGMALAMASVLMTVGRKDKAPRTTLRLALALFLCAACRSDGGQNRDFASNTTLWTSETALNPNNARAWHLLAVAHQQSGRLAQAEDAYLRGSPPMSVW